MNFCIDCATLFIKTFDEELSEEEEKLKKNIFKKLQNMNENKEIH